MSLFGLEYGPEDVRKFVGKRLATKDGRPVELEYNERGDWYTITVGGRRIKPGMSASEIWAVMQYNRIRPVE